MAVDFKPSDVDLLGSFPPLCATMGRTERELAAVLLVRACQSGGDEWKVHTLGEVIADDMYNDREPLHSLSRNPFCRPDMHDCVATGFAAWVGDAGNPDHGVEFTEKGLEALRRWVRKPVADDLSQEAVTHG